MDCQFIREDALRRTPIHRLFSVYGVVSIYIFENIKPGRVSRAERYDFWQVFYLRAGRLRYVMENGREHVVQAGQAIFRPAGQSSSIHYDAAMKNEVFIISFECASPAMALFKGGPVTLFGDEAATLGDLVKTGARIFEPIAAHSREQGLRLKSDAPSALLSYVGASLERFLSMMYCRLVDAKYYLSEREKINTHIRETQLAIGIKRHLKAHLADNPSINQIAAHFGVAPAVMMKRFKRETGLSVIDYLIGLKIHEAMRLISETSMNFAEIADALGFGSANYFSRVFKERVGCTPTEFSRKQSKVGLSHKEKD